MPGVDRADLQRRWASGDLDPRHVAPPHKGVSYLRMLAAAHTALAPSTYFEIGSRWGDSLALAQAAVTVAVDPVFQLPGGFLDGRPNVRLYPMTSDDFFSQHNLCEILGQPLDFAFLDGMHKFEFLLRDLMNTESSCKRNSIVALHDCLPVSSAMAHREQDSPRDQEYDVLPGAWAGDVWKILLILAKYRPNLHVIVFDCPPTGLAFVTNFDPNSTKLRDMYKSIIEKFNDIQIKDVGVAALRQSLNVKRSWAAIQSGRLAEILQVSNAELLR